MNIMKKSLRPMKKPKTDCAHFTRNHAVHSTVPTFTSHSRTS